MFLLSEVSYTQSPPVWEVYAYHVVQITLEVSEKNLS